MYQSRFINRGGKFAEDTSESKSSSRDIVSSEINHRFSRVRPGYKAVGSRYTCRNFPGEGVLLVEGTRDDSARDGIEQLRDRVGRPGPKSFENTYLPFGESLAEPATKHH